MEETQTKELTKKVISNAQAGTLDVANNKEAYDMYFLLGGTVGKMTTKTVIQYNEYKMKRLAEKEEN